MAKSLGISEKELFKLMEQGKLMAAEVLPKFAEQMKKSANTNGAFIAASQKTRAELNRFQTELSLLADDIYTGGFGKGLAHMFKSLTELTAAFRNFSDILGQGFRSAIATVMLPIRILALGIQEVSSWFGASTKEASQFAASLVGVSVAIIGMIAVVRKLAMVFGLLKVAKDAAGFGGAAAGAATAGSAAGRAGMLSRAGNLPMMAMMAAASSNYAASQQYALNSMAARVATHSNTAQVANQMWPTQGLNVNIKVNDSEFGKAIDARVENHDANIKAGILAEGGR